MKTRPLAHILRVRRRRICWMSPESKGEMAEGPQLHTVEAMCKANWPAQRRSTEAERATLERSHPWSWWSLLWQRPLLRLKPRLAGARAQAQADVVSCLVCAGRGEEGEEGEEEGVEGGVLWCVRACAAVPWEEARQEGWARMDMAEAPQPRTVEAMCEVNWPAQGRSTDAEQAAPKTAATRGLEGPPLREERIASPRGPGAVIECG
jgi:hypothetical protein